MIHNKGNPMLKTLPQSKEATKNAISKLKDFNEDILNEFYSFKKIEEGIIESITGFNRKLIPDNILALDNVTLFYKNGILTDAIDTSTMTMKEHNEIFDFYCEKDDLILSNFGLCDNHQQVAEKFKLKSSEINFSIFLKPIDTKNIAKNDNFEWQKKGTYIGINKIEQNIDLAGLNMQKLYEFKIIPWNFLETVKQKFKQND